jgi:hypothetical protein
MQLCGCNGHESRIRPAACSLISGKNLQAFGLCRPVVRISRCGRDDVGSIPAEGIQCSFFLLFLCVFIIVLVSV